MEASQQEGRVVRSRSSHEAVSGRRKAEAVVRVMTGEDGAEVAEALGVSVAQVETWRREFVLAGERRMGELPLGWFERCLSPFERLVPLATLISVTIGVLLYLQTQHKADQQQLADNFNALDDKYIDYAKLCLQHPDLDVFDYPMQNAPPRSPEQAREESMMLSILTSMLERSFLTYHKQTDDFSRKEWASWNTYLRSWLTRPNFAAEWKRSREMYDPDFRVYVDGQLAQVGDGPSTTLAK